MNNFPDKHFEFEVEPKPDDIRVLEDGIYAFNVQTTGISDGKRFGLFLRDADRTAIGGVYGWTCTAEDVPAAHPSDQTKTWLFHMDHAREVAFAASRAFVWDAARINLPDGETALAQSVYPVESAGDAAWGRSTEYLKFAIEDFSRRWFPYPWPNAVNVAGPVGGMEYPGVAFVSAASKGKTLFWITVHEIGHTYFPMVVGANERRYAWMDEGLNTFIDV
jgi:hypothetical protein